MRPWLVVLCALPSGFVRGVEMCGVALGRQLLPLEACGPSSHRSPCLPLCDPRRLQYSSRQRAWRGRVGLQLSLHEPQFPPSETGVRIVAASSGGRGAGSAEKTLRTMAPDSEQALRRVNIPAAVTEESIVLAWCRPQLSRGLLKCGTHGKVHSSTVRGSQFLGWAPGALHPDGEQSIGPLQLPPPQGGHSPDF